MSQRPTEDASWATDSSALKRDPTATMQQRGWDTSDGTPDGLAQKPTLEHTNGWMHNVGEFIKSLSGDNSDPVGTVVMSMLTEQQFNAEVSGSWVKCDGRSCAGTRYSQITGKGTVPDLRSRYLVGSGQNSNSNFGKICDLHETVDAYVYSDDFEIIVPTGGKTFNVGGSYIDLTGKFITGDQFGSAHTANYTITHKRHTIETSNYYPHPVHVEFFYPQSAPNRILYAGPSVGLAPHSLQVKHFSHEHTYNIPATTGPRHDGNMGRNNKSDSDVREIQYDFDDATKFTGLQTNQFIRVN